MLTVTENAAEHLAKLLVEAPEDLTARIVRQPSGLGIQLGDVQPDDATFEHEGRTVLALDPVLIETLSHKTLDVQTTEQGPQLSLQ